MKTIMVLAVMFTAQFSQAWSCSLTTYDDVSDIDRCYGRILDQYIHVAKADLVKLWQYKRTQRS